MTTFKEIVEGVEESNRINNTQWLDWEDASHLQDIYGTLDELYKDVYLIFLETLIRDNGENIEVYLNACDALEYRQIFSGKK